MPMAAKPNSRGADAIAGTLTRAGVKRVFALSGNHIMAVFDALDAAGIEIVHARHERRPCTWRTRGHGLPASQALRS
jgi:hypothetical protein